MSAHGEADTCRLYVVPRLTEAGWDAEPCSIAEQRTFTDGRIIVSGNRIRRGTQKRADYLLRYTRDFPIAVVEAKPEYRTPSAGLGQAKEYAQILGLRFAYSTNGTGIVEFDFTTGLEQEVAAFPSPTELWQRLSAAEGLTEKQSEQLLQPSHSLPEKAPRYYQEVAINRVVQSVVQGKRRILVTMATGTGKTLVAFQVCWKLWASRWNRTGEHRRPKILYLADRNILIDDPKDKTFVPFGDARYKIENGEVVKSREMYFAIYQAIAHDERRPGLFKEFAPNFFDIVIVDECHRGSARADSSWREILAYFAPAVQFGMTATPLRDDNRDTYDYFGNPVYTYSLREGIADGFLAPYRVHRIITTADAAGWRPTKGELDRFGREIPDEEYQTKDFEKVVSLRMRTEAIARHITEFMQQTDRFAKTLVFCVDQEHADEMRQILNNLNADLVQNHPNYVCRVTADEGGVGKRHLSDFQELETETPVILTTSLLLTTGVDAPMVKNVALARVVGSMSEFKQIIGRGTRVREDYGKLFFSILDYTGSATRHFADPDFDGEPELVTESVIDENGNVVDEEVIDNGRDVGGDDYDGDGGEVIIDGDGPTIVDPPTNERRKFYVDGGHVEVAHQVVYEMDASGNQLRVIQYTDYTAEAVRTLFRSVEELRAVWRAPADRLDVIGKLAEKGIDFEQLADLTNAPEADPFDLLCHVAFNAPLRTRRERAERVRSGRQDFFDQYGPEARSILEELLEKYAEHGPGEFKLPDALHVPPISSHGNVAEIISLFGGKDQLQAAIATLQEELYAA